MNTEEILRKAIKKAESKGYVTPSWYIGMIENTGHYQERWEIIFSHSFAKAFWGEKKIGSVWTVGFSINFLKRRPIYEWESQLEQMVLEKDPIKYLEKFL